MERRQGATYRRGAGTKRVGIKREINRGGELLRGGNGLRRRFQPEEEDGDMALASGAHTSARQERNRDTDSGKE
jgi:hypothetical protein